MAAAPPPPAAAAGSQPPAQVVGNAFVHQYYHILHQSPDLVYRFYQETSRLGRPAELGGDMDSVTTMEAINEKIMSMDMVRAEIRAVDAQESLGGGVTVLVTGHLTGRDTVRREFAQSFFLAPQEMGYFVLNDMFRYVGEGEEAERSAEPPQQPEADATAPAMAVANGMAGGGAETAHHEQDASWQLEQDVAEPAPQQPEEDEEEQNEEEVYNPPDDAEGSVVEDEQPVPEVIDEVPNNVATVMPSSAAQVPQEEAPKKSYASIVKVMKEVPPPASAFPSRPAPPKPEKQAPPPAPAPVADVPALSPNPESSNIQEPEVDGHAIYVRNLPLNVTPIQLEDEFKRFGTIKRNGIQVRSHKIQGFCYGFVEFEDASAVQSAIEASHLMIDGRQCHIEEKRATGSRGGSRGRFAPGRGNNFRSEGMRSRGNYSGGRGGYGRGEFTYRGDYGGRGGGRGGSSARGGDIGYQRVDSASAGGRGSRVPSAASAAAK